MAKGKVGVYKNNTNILSSAKYSKADFVKKLTSGKI